MTLASVEAVYSSLHLHAYRGGNTSEGAIWPWIIYDPVLSWMNKPGYVQPEKFRIDENGLRVIENVPALGQRNRLIVCMGDSGTFGIWGNDRVYGGLEFDSFPSYLQGLVAGNHDAVVNAGTIGYTSAHLLRQYASTIRRMNPDIIVIRIGHNDHLPSWDKRADAQPPRNAALRFFYDKLPFTFMTQTIARYAFLIGKKIMDPPWSTPDQYEANLRTLIRVARGDGAKVFLVDYPLRPSSIPPASMEGYLKNLQKMRLTSHAAYIEDHERYMARLEVVARSTGATVIRTRHRLEDPKEDAYSGWDQAHPNKRGMQIVAEEIAKVLLSDAEKEKT